MSTHEKILLEQSYSAFKSDEQQYAYDRNLVERLVNGEIVTDSESDNPDHYTNSRNKLLAIKKKIDALCRGAKRRCAKRIASNKYLQQKTRKVETIVEKYPDIGKTIEEFVQDCNVGADAWRRTGVLTFGGNIKVNKKATYGRIKSYLEKKYG